MYFGKPLKLRGEGKGYAILAQTYLCHTSFEIKVRTQRHIQSPPGHKSSKPTEIYTHITNSGFESIVRPRDTLRKNYILAK